MLKIDSHIETSYVDYVNRLVSDKMDPIIFTGNGSNEKNNEIPSNEQFQLNMVNSFGKWLTTRQ